MIVLIFICTAIGCLCGSAPIGLAVGIAIFLLTVWAGDRDRVARR